MSLISGNGNKIFAKGVIGNVRKAQEDSHGYKLGTPNGDLFVVCDGMGGHVGGATASRIAVDSIIGFIDKEKYATPVDALDGALQFANMQILGHADAHPELKGMGTTACIVLIQGDDVWIGHTGDSRIYLFLGKENQLHRITKDHSFVQTLVDAGEITDEEAEHHPNKNRIMKALGIKPELHPTFNYENRPIHPKNGDIFLICSDGLSGMIPDRTIWSVLGEKSLTLQQKGDTLIDRAMEGETICPGGQDNCTVELIEVDNSPWGESEFKSYNPKGVVYEERTIKENVITREQHNPSYSDSKSTAATEENRHSKANYSSHAPKKKLVKVIAITVASLLVIGGIVLLAWPNGEKKAEEKSVESQNIGDASYGGGETENDEIEDSQSSISHTIEEIKNNTASINEQVAKLEKQESIVQQPNKAKQSPKKKTNKAPKKAGGKKTKGR